MVARCQCVAAGCICLGRKWLVKVGITCAVKSQRDANGNQKGVPR